MSYKKDLEKFLASGTITPDEAISFVIGKKHLRLPKLEEVNQLCDMLNSETIPEGNDFEFEVAKGNTKANMDSLQALIRNVSLTKKNLIQLWNLAKDRRKRQYMIAAISVGSVVVISGAAMGVAALMKKRKGGDVYEEVNDDTSDIGVYEEDIPQVDIDDTEL